MKARVPHLKDYVMRNDLDNLKRDRRPMLMLLGSIAAVAMTVSVIGYSIPELTGEAVATAGDGGSTTARAGSRSTSD
jgi:hypothetical protein